MSLSFQRIQVYTFAVVAIALLLAPTFLLSVSAYTCPIGYPIDCGDGCCPSGRTCGRIDTCGSANCCGSSGSSTNGGAIAGGVIGGLCFVSIAAFFIRRWWCVAAAVGVGAVIGASAAPRRPIGSPGVVVVQQSPAPVMVGAGPAVYPYGQPAMMAPAPTMMYPPQPQPVMYGAPAPPPPSYAAPGYDPGYAMPAQPPPYQAPPPNYVPAY